MNAAFFECLKCISEKKCKCSVESKYYALRLFSGVQLLKFYPSLQFVFAFVCLYIFFFIVY